MEQASSLGPLCGLFKSIERPTFCEAMQDIIQAARNSSIEILVNDIDEAVKKCENKARTEFDESMMSFDEISALLMYSCEFPEGTKSIYELMNYFIRTGDTERIHYFLKFILLLMYALKKCDSTERAGTMTVYRGLHDFPINVRDYAIGKEIVWPQFSSSSEDLSSQQIFVGDSGHRALFHIHLKCGRARRIGDYTFYKNEKESILPPNSRFEVFGFFDAGNGMINVQLKELPPLDFIIDFDSDIVEGVMSSQRLTASIDWTELSVDPEILNSTEARLGDGGFGVVMRARWRDPAIGEPTQVAVKVMRKSVVLSNGVSTTTFERVCEDAIAEAEIVAKARESMFEKDLVCNIYGVATGFLSPDLAATFLVPRDDTCVGIVMRYEAGGSLAAAMQKVVFSTVERLRIITRIAKAVAELHAQRLVHGDLKPSNVLLSHHRPPEVRVADFGTSIFRPKTLDGTTRCAETVTLRGTPMYMAPEMLNYYLELYNKGSAEIVASSRSTDIYSLSMIACEVLTGIKPSAAKNETLLAKEVVELGKRPSLDSLPSDLSPELLQEIGTIITACWDADRQKRLSAVECYSRFAAVYRSQASVPVVSEVDDLKAQIKSTETQLADVQRQVEASQVQLVEARQQAEAAGVQLVEARQQAEAAEFQLAEVRQQAEAAEFQLADARLQAQVREAQLTEAQQRAVAVQAQVDRERERAEIEKRRGDDLKSELNFTEAKLSSVQYGLQKRKIMSSGIIFAPPKVVKIDEESDFAAPRILSNECASVRTLRTLACVRALAFSPDGSYVVFGSDDNALWCWDTDMEKCARSFLGHSGAISSITFSPDGRIILSSSADRTIRVWNFDSGECCKILQGHSDIITCLSMSTRSQHVVSGSTDQMIRSWDLRSETSCVYGMTYRRSVVRCLAHSPDGRVVISGSDDSILRKWDAESGVCLVELHGHTAEIYSLSVSPSGNFVLSGSGDSSVRLWELGSNSCVQIFSGHSGTVRTICFLAGSKYFVSGSTDNTVRVWETETKRCLKTLEGHSNSVLCVAVHPSSSYIVSGSSDQCVRMWA